MRAKQFFYVCAGILILAVGYTLAAHHARAQTAPTIVDVTATPAVGGGISSIWVLDSEGRIYGAPEPVQSAPILVGTAPAGEQAVALGSPIGDRIWVGMVNGNVYEFAGGAGTWTLLGNIFGGTVAVEGTTITDVKEKFREEE